MTTRDPSHDEIKKGQLVKADTIKRKFEALFKPLLNKTRENFIKLSSAIVNSKHFNDLSSVYYGFVKDDQVSKIYELSSRLVQLEEDWSDIEDFDKSKLGTKPLHVLLKNKNRELVAAAGKVRKYDFIGAYNFKGFLESLYGIASELRNISLRGYDNSTLEISCGAYNRFDSYKDLSSYIDDVSSDKIIDTESVNSLNAFSFNDYIINNNTNGDQIYTPDEAFDTIPNHGYIGRSLIPKNIDVNRDEYVNKNGENFYKFGRQTVRQLQSDRNVSTNLESYYAIPEREGTEANKFNYVNDPSTGLINDYLTLKPAHGYDYGIHDISGFKQNSDALSCYCNPKSTRANKIVSKKYYDENPAIGKGQIINAKTVNDLFKELNGLALKISATLCGEYNFSTVTGIVPRYESPLGGLGYPEFNSWYFTIGAASSSTLTSATIKNNKNTYTPWVNSVGTTNISAGIDSTATPWTQTGLLNNGLAIPLEPHFVARTETNAEVIRNGAIYFESNGRQTEKQEYMKIINKSKSSMVPMTYNLYKVTRPNYTDSKNIVDECSCFTIPNNSSDFKEQLLTNPVGAASNSDSVYISPSKYSEPERQIFNRYCLVNPTNIDYANRKYTDTDKRNINSMYIFMPYMAYLNYQSASNLEIYNGKIQNPSNTETLNIKLSSNAGYINNAAGIPVLYEDRSKIWDKTAITTDVVQDTNLGTTNSNGIHYGTVQLKLIDTNNTDVLIDNNFKVNWIEYAISCGLSLNEVLMTHKGWSELKFSLRWNGDSNVQGSEHRTTTITHQYYDYKNDGGMLGTITLPSNNTITSKIYQAHNTYVNNSSVPTDYISSSTYDPLIMLYGNAFKFNDFYTDYNPMSYNDLEVANVYKYFAPGDNKNSFTEANTIRTLSWVTEVSGTISDPRFGLIYSLKHDIGKAKNYPNYWRILQGNFFTCANQSNKIKVNNGSSTYKYKILPQPDPITISNINYYSSTSTLNVTASCNNFWNNLYKVKIKLIDENNTSVSTEFINNQRDISAKSLVGNPFCDADPAGTMVLGNVVTATYNAANHNYDITINAPIGGITGSDISCKLRFENENGGFRDVCKAKATSNWDISSDMFKISVE